MQLVVWDVVVHSAGEDLHGWVFVTACCTIAQSVYSRSMSTVSLHNISYWSSDVHWSICKHLELQLFHFRTCFKNCASWSRSGSIFLNMKSCAYKMLAKCFKSMAKLCCLLIDFESYFRLQTMVSALFILHIFSWAGKGLRAVILFAC